jgi:hypothetical protein
VAEKAINYDQTGIKDFFGLVEHSFTLWNHLHNPPELSSIDDMFHMVEEEVT